MTNDQPQTDAPTDEDRLFKDSPEPEKEPAPAEPDAPVDVDWKFDFSTAAIPPLPFRIDGDVYEMRTLDHLTPREESQLRVLFRKDTYLTQSIGQEVADGRDARALKLSKQQTELRLIVIEMMTTVPLEVAAALRVPDELKLVRAIFQGVEVLSEDEPEDPTIEDILKRFRDPAVWNGQPGSDGPVEDA